MPKIKNLSNACEVSFCPDGPISEEALERVCALLGELNACTMFPSNCQYVSVTNIICCIFLIINSMSDIKASGRNLCYEYHLYSSEGIHVLDGENIQRIP
jgi:hypothetical protein